MANKKQRPGRKRNPVAHHLFIHRGGVHEKSNSAKRQEGKRELRVLVQKENDKTISAIAKRSINNCPLR